MIAAMKVWSVLLSMWNPIWIQMVTANSTW